MTKRKKVLPARKQRDRTDEDSLLVRSAESLGRMIGSLQRQLDGATTRLSERADDVMDTIPGKKKKTATRKRTARKSPSSARKSGRSRPRTTTRSSKKR